MVEAREPLQPTIFPGIEIEGVGSELLASSGLEMRNPGMAPIRVFNHARDIMAVNML